MIRRYKCLILVCLFLLFSSTTGSYARTTVEYWYSDHNQTYWEVVQSLVDRFNKSQNEVTVNLTPAIAGKDFEDKLLTSIMGGVAPDLVHFEGSAVIEWVANNDAFAPLDVYLTRHKITKQSFLPSEWQEGSLWGKQWSVPFRTASRGLYMNQDVVAASGFNPDKGPATLDELDNMARRITKQSPDGKLQIAGFLPWVNNWNLQGWFWTFGGNLFDWSKVKYTINRPEHLRAMNWIKEYADRFGPGSVKFTSGFSGQNERFFRNELAMLLQSTTYMARLMEYRSDMRFTVVKPPVIQGIDTNGNWGGGFSHVIPTTAKNPDGAAIFLAYLSKPETQLEYYKMTTLIPTHFDAVRQLLRVTTDPRVRVMIEGLPTANARTPYWNTIHRNLTKANFELINAQKTPEAILDEQQKIADLTVVNLNKPR